jgi:hypothetical protein
MITVFLLVLAHIVAAWLTAAIVVRLILAGAALLCNRQQP